jgi:hypothetical protein
MQTENDTPKPEGSPEQVTGEGCPKASCSARPTPKEIAQRAWDNGHVPTFLKALCELIMCADPWPASADSEIEVKTKADEMARKLGFSDWVEAYHGL